MYFEKEMDFIMRRFVVFQLISSGKIIPLISRLVYQFRELQTKLFPRTNFDVVCLINEVKLMRNGLETSFSEKNAENS